MAQEWAGEGDLLGQHVDNSRTFGGQLEQVSHRGRRGHGRRGQGRGGQSGAKFRGYRKTDVASASCSDAYVFRCLSCFQFAFDGDALSKVTKVNIVVLDVGIYDRCASRPHPQPQPFLACRSWQKTQMVCCRCCGRDWGIMGKDLHTDLELLFLKITNFHVIHKATGNWYQYQQWRYLPFTVPTLPPEVERRHVDQIINRSFKSSLDISGECSSSGGCVRAPGVQITLPKGAISAGQTLEVLGDSVVLCLNMHEQVESEEQFISGGVQLAPSLGEGGEERHHEGKRALRKHAEIRIQHTGDDAEKIAVYSGNHRGEDNLIALSRDPSADDDYYTTDRAHVYIYTKHVNVHVAYCCVEPYKCITIPMVIDLCITTRVDRQQGVVEMEAYVYDASQVSTQHLTRFRRTLSDRGYSVMNQEKMSSFRSLQPADQLHADVCAGEGVTVLQHASRQLRTVSELFCIKQQQHAPCVAVVLPQMLLAATLTTTATHATPHTYCSSQPDICVDLEIQHIYSQDSTPNAAAAVEQHRSYRTTCYIQT